MANTIRALLLPEGQVIPAIGRVALDARRSNEFGQRPKIHWQKDSLQKVLHTFPANELSDTIPSSRPVSCG